jgi:tRNA pseudouridine55 synthase
MFLLINKPKGLTSHDVVDKIRAITGERRVGHAGTLDPNATGLLIIGVGRQATKRLGEFLKKDKEYEAEIVLGEERETDDAAGKIQNSKVPTKGRSGPRNSQSWAETYSRKTQEDIPKVKILKTLNQFVGEQMQVPPAYSAIKIKGEKAYELARKGESVSLKPRKITTYSIKVEDYKFPVLKITCKVSSGTYIRALARDIGRNLGCGAHLANLKRTKIGDLLLKDALKLEDLNKFITPRRCSR